MTVQEVPVINLLTFQVWDREAGTWTDLATRATSVDIQRGAKQDGAKVETQVGTLEASLYGALDLRRVADLQPNSPIRVIRPPLAPALAWDMMPASATDSVASKGLFSRIITVTQNGQDYTSGPGTNVFNNALQANWWNYGTNVTTIAAGTMLFASPNSIATNPSNPKPVGRFDSGDTYTLRGYVRPLDTAHNPRLQVVIYTGTAEVPTIIAATDPFTPSAAVYPGTPLNWSFTAPDTDDWNVGIVLADTITASTDQVMVTVEIGQFTIWDTGRQRPEFTGTISDIFQSIEYDKATNKKHVYTTVQAVDAVQSLANTIRYGVIARSGAGYQTWADRIQQLADSAHVPIDAPVQSDVTIYDQTAGIYQAGWDQGAQVAAGSNQWYFGGNGQGQLSVYRINGSTAATTLTAARIAQKLRYNLEPGSAYAAILTVRFSKRGGVTGDTWAIGYRESDTAVYGDAIDPSTTTPQTVVVRFSPTAKEGAVGVYQLTTGQLAAGTSTALTFAVTDMRVVKVGQADQYALQDVGYESTLLNHFDLACNSVGARWYVTKRGTALFRRTIEDSTPAARFTDSAAGDVSYTDVDLAYDTRNVVSSLTLSQHGYDPATGNTADESLTFTDDASIARWGSRSSALDTCLYLGAGHENDADQRGRDVLATLRRPKYSVRSFTFNAQSRIDILDALELRTAIAIDYEDIRQQSRVLAIRHSITPTQWMVTVDVNETRSGVRFSDLLTAGNTTFTAFDAAHQQSFRDYNTNPLNKASAS